MEPEICTEMLKNFSEKLGAKFPATSLKTQGTSIKDECNRRKNFGFPWQLK